MSPNAAEADRPATYMPADSIGKASNGRSPALTTANEPREQA
jgi:hypothetical protein